MFCRAVYSVFCNTVYSVFCSAVYDSIDCDKEAIEDLCGDDAGEWVEKYELALYEPYMDQFNCKRGRNSY